MSEGKIGPASRKQALFLASKADITVFGGAAGSGKSYMGLMSILPFVQDKFFTGVIFRRNMPQITNPGGLWDSAVHLYRAFDKRVKIRSKDKEIHFPSGAYVKFSHMELEKNKYDHQGGQYTYILFDEGTHFTESMVTYLISRLRNPQCSFKPRMKITCNPDYDSFLRLWIEWYLDPETGIPLPERDGIVRYFVMQENKLIWANDRKELEAIYGEGDDSGIMSFTFISANCLDNPPLLKADPGYVGRLKSLPRVEMERLFLGSWFAREQASGFWKEEWTTKCMLAPGKVIKRVRAWDISGTIPSESNPNPDWTAGVLMSATAEFNPRYTVEDVVRFRDRHHGVMEMILATAEQDGRDTTVIIPCDPGAAGRAYASQIMQALADKGFACRMKQTNQSKVTRFAPFAAVSEAGYVYIVEGDWNKDYFSELESFDGDRKKKDDQVDATSDAFWALRSSVLLPNFALPEMHKTNEFKT